MNLLVSLNRCVERIFNLNIFFYVWKTQFKLPLPEDKPVCKHFKSKISSLPCVCVWMCITASSHMKTVKAIRYNFGVAASSLSLWYTGMASLYKQQELTLYLSHVEWKVKTLSSPVISDHHVSSQELQLRLPVVWLRIALGPGFLSQQFSPAGGWNPVCLPQEPERQAPAWTKGKPTELWWEPGEN